MIRSAFELRQAFIQLRGYCWRQEQEGRQLLSARKWLEVLFSRLPVADAEGTLIGLLTRRDIVAASLESRRARPEKSEHGERGVVVS